MFSGLGRLRSVDISRLIFEYESYLHITAGVCFLVRTRSHTQAHAHISVKYTYHCYARKLIMRTSNLYSNSFTPQTYAETFSAAYRNETLFSIYRYVHLEKSLILYVYYIYIYILYTYMTCLLAILLVHIPRITALYCMCICMNIDVFVRGTCSAMATIVISVQ